MGVLALGGRFLMSEVPLYMDSASSELAQGPQASCTRSIDKTIQRSGVPRSQETKPPQDHHKTLGVPTVGSTSSH